MPLTSDPRASQQLDTSALLGRFKRILRTAVRSFRPRAADAPPTSGNSMRAGLARAAARGTPIATVIDVGASDGRWTRQAQEFFPSAGCLMMEAQTLHAPRLRETCAQLPNCAMELAVAGPRDGQIHFDATDPFGGVADWNATGAADVLLPMRSIDSIVAERQLAGPFLIKLDTHGFEAPILEGAVETLRSTSLLIVEAYNFQLKPGDSTCLRFHELCAWIEARGFRCIDLCDASRRSDHVLWQMDLFFAPRTAHEFARETFD